MALTLNTNPAYIVHNNATYDVTTSLTESASYNSVRVRSTVYIRGVVVAVIEKPKGLSEFVFNEILKNHCGYIEDGSQSTSKYNGPSSGNNLIASFTDENSNFETFTTSANDITSAVDSNGSTNAFAKSNIFSYEAGDIFVLQLGHDFTDAGANDVQINLRRGSVIVDTIEGSQFTHEAGKIRFLMMDNASGSDGVIALGHESGDVTFDGYIRLEQMTDFDGNVGIHYRIEFKEYYEDADGITQTGATLKDCTKMYFPVKLEQDESWTDYLMSGTGGDKKFLTVDEDNDKRVTIKIHQGHKHQVRSLYVTDEAYLVANYYRNHDYMSTQTLHDSMGWGTVVMNEGNGWVTDAANWVKVKMRKYNEQTTTYYDTSIVYITYVEQHKKYKDIIVLEFWGELGLEQMVFKAEPIKYYETKKTYTNNEFAIKTPYKSYRKRKMRLKSLHEDENTGELLGQLINAQKIFMELKTDTNYGVENMIPVTVVTKKITDYKEGKQFDNVIDIEYYDYKYE